MQEEDDDFYMQAEEDLRYFESDMHEDNGKSVNVWVCPEWFPKGTYSQKFNGFPMNRLLKTQLDYMIRNVVNDWDFTILICGEGEVRVGKSTLAQQIVTYWTYRLVKKLKIELPHSVKENMVFNGKDLIMKGNRLGTQTKYSGLIFDEAGADLESTKVLQSTTKAVKDYLRECGQYNMLNVLVLPEYFDLPKSIALSRSIALLNVYWLPDEKGNFQRGFFKFYNKPSKKKLFIYGKKDLNYNACQETFYGQFPRFYTFDEEEYKNAKKEALKNRESLGEREQRNLSCFYSALKVLRYEGNYTYDQMTELLNKHNPMMKVSVMYVHDFLKRMSGVFRDKLPENKEDSLEIDEEIFDDDGGK